MGPRGKRTQTFIGEGEREGEPGVRAQTSTPFVYTDSPLDRRYAGCLRMGLKSV